MLQSKMTETMAVRMTLVLQLDQKFELPYKHTCCIHRYSHLEIKEITNSNCVQLFV